MKPGNLIIQGAKSGGKTKDEDSIVRTSDLGVRFFYSSAILNDFHLLANLLFRLIVTET